MKICHAALYVQDLEREKLFFKRFFSASAGDNYHNTKTGFSSCFLRFEGDAALELMHEDGLSDSGGKRLGYGHIAISVGSKDEVDRLTVRISGEGYTVISGPRTTGDGYYESCVLDDEGNRIELTV